MELQAPADDASTAQETTDFVPRTWPGAFGIFKYSRQAILLNIWPIVGLIALYLLTSIVFSSPETHHGSGAFSTTHPWSFIGSLIDVLWSTAFTFILLAAVRGTKMSLDEALNKSLPLYFRSLLLSLLTGVIAFVSLVLLIVPFFIIVPRLELALFFLVDKNLGPVDALKASWQATKGNVGKVWGIYGATLAMALLILVLVGIYFVIMYLAAFAILYTYLADQNPVIGAAPAPSAETSAVQK